MCRIIARSLNTILVYFCFTCAAGAQVDPFRTWNWILGYPTPGSLNQVIYDGEQFLAAGEEFHYITSKDGQTWDSPGRFTEESFITGTPLSISALSRGNDTYLASGPYGCYLSRDGVTWSTNGFAPVCNQILFANGHFLARYSDKVYSSTNGIDRTSVALPQGGTLASDGQRFLHLTADKRLLLSTNTREWETVTPSHPDWISVLGINFLGNQWFASGSNEVVFGSADGRNWTLRNAKNITRPAIQATKAAFNLGDRYFLKTGAKWMTSEGGEVWQYMDQAPPQQALSFASGNGTVVACGINGWVAASTNGSDWNIVTRGPIPFQIGAGDCRDGYLAVSEWQARRIVTTTNRSDWVTNTLNADVKLNSIAVGNRIAVACDLLGRLYRTKDWMNWAPPEAPPSQPVSKLEFVQNQFMALGASGILLTSTDGDHWETRSGPTTPKQTSFAITWFKGRYYSADGSNTVYSSSDLTEWQRGTNLRPFRLGEFNRVQFAAGDDLLLAVASEDTFVTADGVHWRTAKGSLPAGANDIAWANGYFLAASPSSSMRFSRDGNTWTRSKFTLHPTADISFDEGRLILFTSRGTVLYSEQIPLLAPPSTPSGPFRVYGDPGATYQLESRSQLSPSEPWVSRGTLTLDANPTLFQLPRPGNAESRYYRTRASQ